MVRLPALVLVWAMGGVRCASRTLGHSSLLFVRHGQSEWNLSGRFTGWSDVALTPAGCQQAAEAGELVRGLQIDAAYTSELSRAQQTLQILLEHARQQQVHVVTDWRLNERHYGALQGRYKQEVVDEFGVEQVKLWRNSFAVPPPPVDDNSPENPANDPKYDYVPRELLPNGECLKDTLRRCLPFWDERVVPDLCAGRTVLIAAHGHSIRALIKHLDNLTDSQIASIRMPNGVPLLYRLDQSLQPIAPADDQAAEPLRGVFLGDDGTLSERLRKDAACVGPDEAAPMIRSASTNSDGQPS